MARSLILSVMTLCWPSEVTASDSASIIALGFLSSNSVQSGANDISSDGAVVVGYIDEGISREYRRAFRWTLTSGLNDLGEVPGSGGHTEATAVSGDGTVVVGVSQFNGFRWSTTSGIEALPHLSGAGISRAEAVSQDGSTIVGYSISSNSLFRGVKWTNGAITQLPIPASSNAGSHALGCSSNGVLAVGIWGGLGCRWKENDVSSLGDLSPCPSFHNSTAKAISPDGSVVVGTSYPENGTCDIFDEAFTATRWTESGGLEGLDRFSTEGFFQALGVSDSGNVIVGQFGSFEVAEFVAVVWNQSKRVWKLWDILAGQRADLSHWRSLSTASAVSPDGRHIVGAGVNTDGKTEAFLIRLASASLGPVLATSISSSNTVVLRWSAALINCALESTTTPGAQTSWTTVTSQPAIQQGEWVVSLPLADEHRFFRLRCP